MSKPNETRVTIELPKTPTIITQAIVVTLDAVVGKGSKENDGFAPTIKIGRRSVRGSASIVQRNSFLFGSDMGLGSITRDHREGTSQPPETCI